MYRGDDSQAKKASEFATLVKSYFHSEPIMIDMTKETSYNALLQYLNERNPEREEA